MNIAYITNIRVPTEKAHGFQVMKMCEAFGAANHSVELIVPRRFNHIKTDPFKFYKVRQNFSAEGGSSSGGKITKLFCLDFFKLPFFSFGQPNFNNSFVETELIILS